MVFVTGAPSYAETPSKEQLTNDVGDDDEVVSQVYQRLEVKAEGGMLDERQPPRRGHSLRSL